MGSIRLLLAISVVLAHTTGLWGFELVGGRYAVQAFYMISGFYMTLILNEKYIGDKGSYKLFITNRLLRLYPIYWVVLLLTIGAYTYIHFHPHNVEPGFLTDCLNNYKTYYGHMDAGGIAYLCFTNIFLFFQETIYFLGIDINSGSLFFTSDFMATHPPLFKFIFVPQAWTLGIELMFYVIAPFIVRRNLKLIIALVIASLALREYTFYNLQLQNDPWTHRFFPTELGLFLLGTIAYHIYKRISVFKHAGRFGSYLLIVILLFILVFSKVSLQYRGPIFLATFFIALPFIFQRTRNMKYDAYIGELSYPVYISHILIVIIVNYLGYKHMEQKGLLVTICTLFLSILLNELVAKRVEKKRQQRVLLATRH